ncbi:hypothetical protein JCM11491_000339 [Sporobolomyces phaffii]
MPTGRLASRPPSRFEFYPPTLSALVAHRTAPDRVPNPRDVPPSTRYRNQAPPPFGGDGRTRYDTLEQEIDALDHLQEEHEIRLCDTKEFGYSWLVPLGRQTTHEEEDDDASQFSTSLSTGHPHRALDLLPPPPELGPDPAGRRTATTLADEADPSGRAREGDASVVDLDAEIEDADRSDDDASDDDDDGGDDDEAAMEDGDGAAGGGRTRSRARALGERQDTSTGSVEI